MIKNFEEVKKALDGTGNLMASVEFEPYDTIMLRPDFLLDKFQDKKVIHLGCTDHIEIIQRKLDEGNYLHNLITCVAQKCVGVDINKRALEYVKGKGIDNVYYGDITQPGIEVIIQDHYDYILLGEMLEHVENPVDFLKKIILNYKEYIDKFVITVPNAFGLPFLSNALNNGREEVNSDHKYWFTPYTIAKVVHQAGMKIDDLQMCIYETSKEICYNNYSMLKSKPILLDTIAVVCSPET